MNGYEQTYNWVIQFLETLDFAEAAINLGFTVISNDTMAVDFLARKYLVDRHSIELAERYMAWEGNSASMEFNIKSIIGYYAISPGRCEPLNDFYPMDFFSHGVFSGGKNSGADWMTGPLRKEFGNDYKKFSEAALRLGMQLEGSDRDGKYTWFYRLFPKVPIKVVYYEGDDEFPSDVKILYDKTAIQFFKFEPLAVLTSCFIYAVSAVGHGLHKQ